MRFTNRQNIIAVFAGPEGRHEWQCGEALRRTEAPYTSKVLGTKEVSARACCAGWEWLTRGSCVATVWVMWWRGAECACCPAVPEYTVYTEHCVCPVSCEAACGTRELRLTSGRCCARRAGG